MKIGNEEVELVTDFATLRAGMIVWTKPCTWCGKPERGILTTLARGKICIFPEGKFYTDLWYRLPIGCRSRVISAEGVARGIVFRVVDPLLDAKPVTRAKELQRG